MPTIQVSQLSKIYQVPRKDPGLKGAVKALFRPTYEDVQAVNGISFAIEPGEIVGYIGVNGAGKSTTIKMLTGILLPTSGQVQVLGRDPYQQRVANAQDIGVVFGQRSQLWWDLAYIESLNLIARMYELDNQRYQQRLKAFTELLDLGELLHTPVRNLSLGQKMRAELAATFIHDPKIVYLDEPTIGLDVLVKERIRAVIKQINQEQGTTIVLTTHDLADIEELCSRVIIIDHGKLIYDGPLTTIRDRFGRYRALNFEMAQPLNGFTCPIGAEIDSQEGRLLTLRFDRTTTTASQVTESMMRQCEVLDFSLTEPNLNTIVKQIYNGALDHTP
jgi:ABC-2 type transport system ATP-binding protein